MMVRSPRPFRFLGMAVTAFFIAALTPCIRAEGSCGAAKDLVVRALERVRPDSPPSDFADALELLKHATSSCSGLGDAWYYRSLVERRLGHTVPADYALKKADLVGSDALTEKLDPFIVITATVVAPAVGVPTDQEARGTGTSPGQQPAPAPVPMRPQVLTAVREKWALVIGIGQFSDPKIPQLRYTTQDAMSFAALLQDSGYGRFKTENVHLVTDAQATTRNIKAELNWLARVSHSDDLVVIYLATHGSSRSMDTAGVNYIITHDTEITDPDALYATALPMIEVSNAVASRVRARRTAIFLDTCYSGAAVTQERPTLAAGITTSAVSSDTLDRLRQGEGRVVVTASKVNQKSWESQALGHGYFTYYLLQALKQDKGLVSLKKVYTYVREQVSQHVLADWRAEQTPVISESADTLDFVLGAPVMQTTASTSRQISGSSGLH